MADLYIPGRGCGCPRCLEPLPSAEVQTSEQAAAKQVVYQASRAAWREAHGIPNSPAGRDVGRKR